MFFRELQDAVETTWPPSVLEATKYKIYYNNIPHFEALAKQIGIMPDEKVYSLCQLRSN
jgi:hypothetical protein